MSGLKSVILASALVVLSGQGFAQGPDHLFGGDVLRAGDKSTPLMAERDVLAAGATVALSGSIAQDVHAAGFDVDVDASTGGDLYAIGFSVSLRGPIGGDVMASGFSVRTAPGADIAGNARFAGARVTIDGPVQGALAAAGGKVALNAMVNGDVMLAGETLSFGPDAHIGGTLTYSAPQKIDIPERVLAADRITFEPFEKGELMKGAHEVWSDWEYPMLPTFLSVFSGFLITLGFFVLIGALFLTFAPTQVRRLRHRINARPGMALLSGVVGLSILFGLVPISAMTVVGIPLVPIVILVVLAIWTLGYVLGAYVLAIRALQGLGGAENPEIWMRLLALLAGVTIAALLNFIPVIGWMVNFALVLLGVGGMTTALFDRMIGNFGPALDEDLRPYDSKPE